MSWWGWLIVILIALWVIHNPGQASADVHNLGSFLDSFTR
jgi:hypothetical protein